MPLWCSALGACCWEGRQLTAPARALFTALKALQKQAVCRRGSKMSLNTSIHTWCTETISPSLTLRLLRTILFMRILLSSTALSTRTVHTVSLRFLPCTHMGQSGAGTYRAILDVST